MASTSSHPRKVVIITGATNGIGRDLAERLHARGYNVAFTGRRVHEGEKFAAQLDPKGDTSLFIECHVQDYESQAAVFKTVWHKWARLDVLIANAGIVDVGSRYNLARKDASVDDVPPCPDLSCTDADLKGVIYGTELAVHYMRHNPGGSKGKIIVTGSIAAIYPLPTMPEYCAAKAGVLQWVRVMAPMLGKEDITINVVLPNGYDTGILPGFKEAYLDKHLTKKECLMSAYDTFLDDAENEKNGQAIETAYESHYSHDVPPYKSGYVIERTDKVYEPWFEMMHQRRSGLENAYKEPLRKSSDAAVRLLAQQIKLGKERVIATIDDGLIFSSPAGQPLPSGQAIWNELFESATELYVAALRAWGGRSIAEEFAVVGDDIEIALLGVLVMKSQVTAVNIPTLSVRNGTTDHGSLAITNGAASVAMFGGGGGLPYSITIRNGITSNPMEELTLIDNHLFDSWLVTKSHSPPLQPLRRNDSATLAWSYYFSWLTSGGILGFYDGWLAYRLSNGRAFAVRVHVPTQVGPFGVGTRPSYMTAVNITDPKVFLSDRAWTYHDDPSKPYTFPENDLGDYEITITSDAGQSSLVLDVQVMKKWIPHSS